MLVDIQGCRYGRDRDEEAEWDVIILDGENADEDRL